MQQEMALTQASPMSVARATISSLQLACCSTTAACSLIVIGVSMSVLELTNLRLPVALVGPAPLTLPEQLHSYQQQLKMSQVTAFPLAITQLTSSIQKSRSLINRHGAPQYCTHTT